MSKIAIITDSTSCLNYTQNKYNIPIIPLTVNFGEEEIVDGKGFDPDNFYNRLATEKVNVSTSQPQVESVVKVYEQLKAEGYTDVIYITISSELSGTWQSGVLAKSYIDDLNIHVIDSKTVAIPLGEIANHVALSIQDDKSVEDILAELDYMIEHSRVFFMLDDLKFLVKGGRLSNASSIIGTMLKVKPLITINNDGKVEAYGKVRKSKKAITELQANLKEYISKYDPSKVKFLMTHGIKTKTWEELYEQCKENFVKYAKPIIAPISPVVATHGGPYVYGIGCVILP